MAWTARRIVVWAGVALVVVLVGATVAARHAAKTCRANAAHPLEEGGGVALDRIEPGTAGYCRLVHGFDKSAPNALRLGRALIAIGAPGPKAEGFALVKSAFEAGYAVAGVSLSELYRVGTGTNADVATSRRVIEAVIATDPPFLLDARAQLGAILLASPDEATQRQGLRLLGELSEARPALGLTIGNHYAVRVSSSEHQQAALDWYEFAARAGVPEADIHLGALRGDERSPLADLEKAYRHYVAAERAGVADGWTYGELARLSYYGKGTPRRQAQAFEWAVEGSARGNGFSSFMAGVMLLDADDVANDSLRAEAYMELAAQQGYEGDAAARERARGKASAVRAIPNGEVSSQSCVIRETASHDRNVYYFNNGCSRPINVYLCQSQIVSLGVV